MATTSAINVIYEYVGGAHFLWSKDERARGLCVASRDLSKAFASVSHQLETIAKVERNEDVKFVPGISAAEFGAWLGRALPKLLEDKPAAITPNFSSEMAWRSGQIAA